MPRDAVDSPTPLTIDDIQRILQSLLSQPGDTIEAFAVTAASLYGWCDPVAVDAALAMCAAVPIPQCIHGKPWNGCWCRASVQRAANTN